MKIVVASKNPVKVDAARCCFSEWFGKTIEAVGVSVPSGVPDQPMGDEETLRGARNRANAARAHASTAAFVVAFEGGCAQDDDHRSLSVFAWVVILDCTTGQSGESRTASFALPPRISRLVVEDGMELGDADDVVFGRSNSKQESGVVGLLTEGRMTRKQYYQHACLLALIPVTHPLYKE